MTLERRFQLDLVRTIKERLPGCYVMKVDTGYYQGYPDLLILHNDRWAMLEVKRDAKAKRQPNQDYYVEEFNKLSYASVIYPENVEEVLDDLQQALSATGVTRDLKR